MTRPHPRPAALRMPRPVPAGRPAPAGKARRLPALPALVLAGLVLAACGGAPQPTGELREILDENHQIADPGIIGASATGRGCAVSRNEALTMARRVAQFNLRSLTGSARYKVRYELLDETEDLKGFCVVFSARAVAPKPYVR